MLLQGPHTAQPHSVDSGIKSPRFASSLDSSQLADENTSPLTVINSDESAEVEQICENVFLLIFVTSVGLLLSALLIPFIYFFHRL